MGLLRLPTSFGGLMGPLHRRVWAISVMVKIKQLGVSMVLALTGCVSLAPEYQRPPSPVAARFSSSQAASVEAPSHYQDHGWRQFFHETQVQRLIEQALRNNRDLRQAVLNVRLARTQLALQQAERYPQLDASAQANYRDPFAGGASSREYQLGGALGFELDLFGRLQSMSEQERQNFLASQQAQRAVQILVVANVAQAYFTQQLAYAQLRIAEETLQNYRQSYSLIEQQVRAGSNNLLALEQARGQIESTQATLARREGELAQANHAIQRLVGVYGDLPGDQEGLARGVEPLALPVPLPSTILLQRPDIMEAEHLLQAADANIGAARAAFFPSISLSGGVNSSGSDLAGLFSAAGGMWSFVPKVTLPIFNGGRNRANLQLAELRQQQSIVNYENKIQAAFKEVDDALSTRDSLADQLMAQQRYLDALQATLQRARGLYAHGALSYLEVLDAERALFTTRQTLLDLRYAQQANEITLFAALGGGWQA
ncbi:Cation efflux system protein CusC precursor [Edwardsiella tarda]|nr:Cation efflux system protein CusC precursor [Edwardsiella tarda]STD45150.1 Cation efflux system protein CusC precursor [Edwardsiella tarda]